MCAWRALSLVPLLGGRRLGEDSRSSGQLCVDWLAMCQVLDTPLPRHAFCAFRFAGQWSAWLLSASKGAGLSFRKGQLSPGPGGGGSIKAARCYSNPGLCENFGENRQLSPAQRLSVCLWSLVPVCLHGEGCEAEVPPCPVLSHGHPPGSSPQFSAPPIPASL